MKKLIGLFILCLLLFFYATGQEEQDSTTITDVIVSTESNYYNIVGAIEASGRMVYNNSSEGEQKRYNFE